MDIGTVVRWKAYRTDKRTQWHYGTVVSYTVESGDDMGPEKILVSYSHSVPASNLSSGRQVELLATVLEIA